MIWQDIPGYEGLYQISDEGQVRTMERYVRSKGGSLSLRASRIMRLQEDEDGYYFVGLTKFGKQRGFRVNRLVAMTFIPNPNNLPIVHHKDNNKKNNRVDNLAWVSISENTLEAIKCGALKFDKQRLADISKLAGAKHRKAVICEESGVRYESIQACSKAIGLGADALVRHIAHHEHHKGLHYVFADSRHMDNVNVSNPFKRHFRCVNNKTHEEEVVDE